MIYCLKLSFYMKDIWCTNVQYYIDLILMEGPGSYTMDSRYMNNILLFIGICWTIFRHAYTWVVKKQ